MKEINLAGMPLVQVHILDVLQEQWEQDSFSAFQIHAGFFARRVLRLLWPIPLQCACAKVNENVIETDFGPILLCLHPDRAFRGIELEQRDNRFARIDNFSQNASDYEPRNPLNEVLERLKRIEAQLSPTGEVK